MRPKPINEVLKDPLMSKKKLADMVGLSPSMITVCTDYVAAGDTVQVIFENGQPARIRVKQPIWRYIKPKDQVPGARTRNY